MQFSSWIAPSTFFFPLRDWAIGSIPQTLRDPSSESHSEDGAGDDESWRLCRRRRSGRGPGQPLPPVASVSTRRVRRGAPVLPRVQI
jgi:hypothetical protein